MFLKFISIIKKNNDNLKIKIYHLTLKQILDKLAAITGLPSPKLRVPYVMALATGVVDELVTGRIRGREPRPRAADRHPLREARRRALPRGLLRGRAQLHGIAGADHP